MIDLGNWAAAINERGQVVGLEFVGGLEHPFLWQRGRLTDLGTLRGAMTGNDTAINEQGQIVGSRTRAFLWQNGRMRDLGTLRGGTGSYATAINERGQIVGTSDIEDASGKTASHAFLWQNGRMRDLGTPGRESFAAAINEQGQVIGNSRPAHSPDAPARAFVWQNGKMTDLGTLGGKDSQRRRDQRPRPDRRLQHHQERPEARRPLDAPQRLTVR